MSIKTKTVFWFTGLPCSGKTTIAEYICNQSPHFDHLDGDALRKTICADLGYSLADRKKNLERIARYALKKLDTFDLVLVTTISPLEVQRQKVRAIFDNEKVNFYLVYIEASLQTCIQRDVKGMYAKALKGEIQQFTGVSSPYEIPTNSHFTFNTERETLEEIEAKFRKFAP